MPEIRPLIVGNWKMHGLEASLAEARAVAEGLGDSHLARVGICAPATLLSRLADALRGTGLLVGGEDVHAEPCGAFTGDVSAEMLADAGARLVIVGHSERRAAHGETDEMVAAKARAALRGGLEPIVCVGESRAERDAGRALEVICRQARGSVPPEFAEPGRPFALAYEPIWAIGSGRTPNPEEIGEAHAALRGALVSALGPVAGGAAPILFGGSVTGGNAAEILQVAEVGGALVGGASLRAEDFLPIVRAAPG